ncbi:hypothetical protein DFS33DRAFT_1341691 [Desarmillaria ectypa]|nr:hypothetical protein DFS33DRAFT_1341691 [Desarmillaria ectypa]
MRTGISEISASILRLNSPYAPYDSYQFHPRRHGRAPQPLLSSSNPAPPARENHISWAERIPRTFAASTECPLYGPVMDAPLAVCDARTLDPKDMAHTIDKYGSGYFIKHHANMKWMYVRDKMPDEILVFRQFDSTLIPTAGDAVCIAYTAFIDEEQKKNKEYVLVY